MYRIITLILLFCSINVYGQFLPGVKHIEVISDLQDSMVLLNKPDIDKINKTYFEKEKLDSVSKYHEQLINLLEHKIELQDSIITSNQLLLKNEISINTHLRQSIEDNTIRYEQQLHNENMRKIGWQTATGAAIIGVILALILK